VAPRGCLIVAAATLAAACASARPPRPPDSPPGAQARALVLLLPDDATSVGRAVVANGHGTVDLDMPRQYTRVGAGTPPSSPAILDEREVQALFKDALAALPPAPLRFTLFFKFESEELTDDSRQMLQDVLRAVRDRPVPDVVAVGHTDTTGQARANVRLGLRRAAAVRSLLVNAGLAAKAVEVTSHGEAELLVKTADGVFEPRNRRVEVTVR
jgi:outer membrane protein OmpA-like peptidoglycan-associated protein